MRVTFERVVVVEGSPEKLEKFLGENTFVYWVKGPNGEIWSLAPDFIRERYEGHFYLVDFEEESFLLASTVTLKLPVLGNRVARFEGKRKAVARRVKLHLIDPFRRILMLQKSGNVGIGRVFYLALVYALFAWLNPYLLLVIVPITLLEFVPGSEKVVMREGEYVKVFSRDRRAVFAREFLLGTWLLVIGVGATIYRAYLGQEDPEEAIFLAALTFALAVDEYWRFQKRRRGGSPTTAMTRVHARSR